MNENQINDMLVDIYYESNKVDMVLKKNPLSSPLFHRNSQKTLDIKLYFSTINSVIAINGNTPGNYSLFVF